MRLPGLVDHPDAIARDVLSGHGDVVADLDVWDRCSIPDDAEDMDAQGVIDATEAAGEGVIGIHGGRHAASASAGLVQISPALRPSLTAIW